MLKNCGCTLCVSNLLITVLLNLIFLLQYKKCTTVLSLHLVRPLLLVGVVDLQRAFQSDCFLFACNQLKFQKQGGWPAVSEIWLMCTPIGGLAPSCLTTPFCPYQGLISHIQDYLQTSATVVVLGKIPIVLYRSWPFPTSFAHCSWWGHWGWILRGKNIPMGYISAF